MTALMKDPEPEPESPLSMMVSSLTRDPDPRIRTIALDTLIDAATDLDQPYGWLLIDAMRDEHAGLRERAVAAVLALEPARQDSRIAADISNLLRDPNPAVRKTALELGRTKK